MFLINAWEAIAQKRTVFLTKQTALVYIYKVCILVFLYTKLFPTGKWKPTYNAANDQHKTI